MYDWVTSLYSRNWHSILNQPYSNKNFKNRYIILFHGMLSASIQTWTRAGLTDEPQLSHRDCWTAGQEGRRCMDRVCLINAPLQPEFPFPKYTEGWDADQPFSWGRVRNLGHLFDLFLPLNPYISWEPPPQHSPIQLSFLQIHPILGTTVSVEIFIFSHLENDILVTDLPSSIVPITPCFPPLLGILCKSCPECYFLNELMIPVLPVSLRWRSIYLCANDLKLLSICIDSVPWCSFGSFSGPPLSLPIHTLLSVYFIFPTVNSLMAEPFKHQTPMART